MGDRGNIGFVGTAEARDCVFLYTHWAGSMIPELVRDAIETAKPRWGDPSYATRMALTKIIGGAEGPLGWGVDTQMGDNEHDVPIIDWNRRTVHVVPALLMEQYWHLPESRDGLLANAPRFTFDEVLDGVLDGLSV